MHEVFTKPLTQLMNTCYLLDIVVENLRKAEGRVLSRVFKNARLLNTPPVESPRL